MYCDVYLIIIIDYVLFVSGLFWVMVADIISILTTSLEALHQKVDTSKSKAEYLWMNICNLHTMHQTKQTLLIYFDQEV